MRIRPEGISNGRIAWASPRRISRLFGCIVWRYERWAAPCQGFWVIDKRTELAKVRTSLTIIEVEVVLNANCQFHHRAILLLLLALAQLGCQTAPAPRAQAPLTTHADDGGYSAVFGDQQGAAATVNPLATQAAMDAFRAGGNAVDAALAAAFTLGVVDSHNSGIGGGCFILARLADGRILALDGREMAPAAAHRDMYVVDGELEPSLSKVGPLAVGIPGSVAALHELQRAGGELNFARVVRPAAELAESGFPIDRTLAMRLESTAATLRRFPGAAEIFLDARGEPRTVGETLVQKDLARSYRALAENGPEWFYRGAFAESVGQWMAEHGGLLTEQDFADYRVVRREPVRSRFAGYTVLGFPPPSSGGVHVAQILNMLSAFDLAQLADRAPADYYHVVAEAQRRAFADRAHWLGDADYVSVPKGLVSESYAARRAQTIDRERTSAEVTHGVPADADSDLFGKHTTHLATADASGNWVAITTTVNTSFGSKVVVPGTGVILNNQMNDFSTQPGVPNAYGLVGAEANAIAPGKRPLSSMSPTLVLKNGEPVMTLGAAGGPTIISQVAQTLVRALALDAPLAQAVAGLRVHQQWRPDLLFIEKATPPALREALQAKGHQLREMGSFGGTQAIAYGNGWFYPVTEPRVIERNAP